jgi:tripeptidyl-peptidase I
LQKLGDRFSGLYNHLGRGYPDVSAQGYGFAIVDKGIYTSVDGTSASAPTFASIIALLNHCRTSAGKPPLGFLNPWLYSTASNAFNNIVKGGSTGCTGIIPSTGLPGGPIIPYASWNATKGWSPVTGLGTPDFGKLLGISTPTIENKGRNEA